MFDKSGVRSNFSEDLFREETLWVESVGRGFVNERRSDFQTPHTSNEVIDIHDLNVKGNFRIGHLVVLLTMENKSHKIGLIK